MEKTSLANCFAALADSEIPLAMATVVQAVSPTAAAPGDKALVSGQGIVDGWIGGGCAQPAVIAAAAEVLHDGQARLIRVAPKGEWTALDGVADFNSGCLSGGTLVIFIEPLQRPARLAIFGSSPVARHLSRLAEEVGFAVALACPDADAGDYPNAVQIAGDFTEIGGDFIVIATQGRHDRAALKAALDSDAAHIAMVASAKKAAGLKAGLASKGIAESELSRIHSPAGIEIGAATPAEIALSVLAELVRQRRTAGGRAAVKSTAVESVPASGGCCGS